MWMKSKIVNNLFGKDLVQAMRELLEEFVSLDYDVEMIQKAMKDINESVRTGLYLMALEKNYDVIANRIQKANRSLNEIRKEKFLQAYQNKKMDLFLASLGKGDKLALMSDLGLDVAVKDRGKFTKEEKEYYQLLSHSIMEDQELDQRDGIDQFVTYKKES